MPITAPPPTDVFRTLPLREAPAQGVDRQHSRILGAKVIQLGEINDSRQFTVDETTLDQVVEIASQPNKGLKARFNHPNASGDSLGTYVGRWTNFRRVEDAVLADLQIAEAAASSPRGDLRAYILDLAEEDPEAFGVSLATRLHREQMERERSEAGIEPLRFRQLRAADVVDDPAATRGGLFDSSDVADLPEQLTFLLDTHFAGASPGAIRQRFESFLSRYFFARGMSMADPKHPSTAPRDDHAPATDPPAPHARDNPPAEPPPTALEAEPIDLESVRREGQLAERTRVKKIKALCDLAGCPDKAQTFIDAEFSVEETQGALGAILEKQRKVLDDDDRATEPAPEDRDARFKEEYQKNLQVHQRFGVSEEDYVASRRISEGLEPLQPAA